MSLKAELYYHDCSGTTSQVTLIKAEVRRSFITTTVRDDCSGPKPHTPGHTTRVTPQGRHWRPTVSSSVPLPTTRAPPVGFELATIGIQFSAIANLDKRNIPNDDAIQASFVRLHWPGWAAINCRSGPRYRRRRRRLMIQVKNSLSATRQVAQARSGPGTAP